MNTPRVSILMPVHNAQRWLDASLRSAQAQSWPATEVIVVDDGSTDASPAIALRHTGPGLQFIHHPRRRGAAAARNTALRAAQGDYLQFLDADDLLHPHKIAAQMARVQRDGAPPERLYSARWRRFVDRPEQAIDATSPLWQDLAAVAWLRAKFEHNCFMCPAAWLVSRRLSDLAGPWNEGLSLDDDGEYACRLVAASDGVDFVPEAVCAYRVGHGGGLSARGDAAALQSQWRSLQLCISHLLALDDSPRSRAAALQLLQDNLGRFHPEQTGMLAQFHALAYSLGGQLAPPSTSRAMRAAVKLLGWPAARRARAGLNLARLTLQRVADSLLSRRAEAVVGQGWTLERPAPGSSSCVEQQPGV
ncbi:MAG: hypothetical protein RIQ60_2157 [Pseudomonadota bacterium]|jgi:GT2 family glycosyltransferase